MKRYVCILLCTAMSIVMLVSCAQNVLAGNEAKVYEISNTVHQLPIVAQMNVEQTRVRESITHSVQGANIENLKAVVVQQILNKRNADVLMEPLFSWEVKGSKITVTVTGYPAKYTNFRDMTPSDVELIEAGNLIKLSR